MANSNSDYTFQDRPSRKVYLSEVVYYIFKPVINWFKSFFKPAKVSESNSTINNNNINVPDMKKINPSIMEDKIDQPSAAPILEKNTKTSKFKKFIKNPKDTIKEKINETKEIITEVLAEGTVVAMKVIQDESVKQLIESAEFKALKTHCEKVLINDKRNHTYFFGKIDLKVEEKTELLEVFIGLIEINPKEKVVNSIIKSAFEHDSEGPNAMQILSKGQNATTRIFNFFLPSTTGRLMNAVYDKWMSITNQELSFRLTN